MSDYLPKWHRELDIFNKIKPIIIEHATHAKKSDTAITLVISVSKIPLNKPLSI